jgi:ribosomal protein S18 acetylase RimI-like enzyme
MSVRFRLAIEADIPDVVALLKDDVLGQGREISSNDNYLSSFRAMEVEPHNNLVVGEAAGKVVAVYQLTLISGLSLSGTRRAQIEGVRVAQELRGQGIGAAMIKDAEDRARQGGAGLLQFTSNKTRDRALEFYRGLGFIDSHTGFKKPL